jgi:hypothetical protein
MIKQLRNQSFFNVIILSGKYVYGLMRQKDDWHAIPEKMSKISWHL